MTGEQLKETHQRGPETGRDPAEQNPEQNQDAGLQRIRQYLRGGLQQRLVQDFFEVDERPALVRHDAFHVPAGDDGLTEHQHQQYVATDRTDGAPARSRQDIFVLRRLRRVGATGQATPAAHQNVGAPWLRHDFGPTNRRSRLEQNPTAGVQRQHFGVLQFFGGAQGQALAD
ncbi:hypothetical protein D3C73_473160 [compost metagenome]